MKEFDGVWVFKVGVPCNPPLGAVPLALRNLIRRRAYLCLLPHTSCGWNAIHSAHMRDYIEKPYWTTIESEEPELADLASAIFWTSLEGVGHFGETSFLILVKNRWRLMKLLTRRHR